MLQYYACDPQNFNGKLFTISYVPVHTYMYMYVPGFFVQVRRPSRPWLWGERVTCGQSMSTQPTSYSVCGLEQLLWQRDCGVTSLSLMSMTLKQDCIA